MEEKKQVRIGRDDSPVDIILKLSDGNDGALVVCTDLFQHGAKIGVDAALKSLAPLLALDAANIYASRIWMLYKNVCGEDLTKMSAVLRASQLGFLSAGDLNHAIDNYGEGIDVDNLELQVRARLPHFGMAEE